MSTATKKNAPLQPPDERFWQRYSPHHELPLAGMTSVFVHGLIIGGMALAAFWYLFQRESESNRPPSMDLVQLSAGNEGAGAEPGLPGEVGPTQTEAVPSQVTKVTDVVPDAKLQEARPESATIPDINFSDTKVDIDAALANLAKDADEQARKEIPKKPAKIVMPSGTSNPKGQGGQGGSGGGPGKGTKGSGLDSGGLGGRMPTKAEIYAWRWKFNLGTNAKEHVDQLKAIGFAVLLVAPSGETFCVTNLSRVPIEMAQCNPDKYRDSAQWKNDRVESLLALAKELKLNFVPARVIMCMPLDRQEKIAEEELRFTKAHNNELGKVRQTHFIFRLNNGVYTPEATLQENYDGRVVAKR